MLKVKPSHILVFFLLLGSFLRLYRIRQTMQFLGDQGRDALIVRRILLEKHPALIGPVTSVGNMYLGPFYYYFMLLPLMLTYPDPSGPAIAVSLVGIVTLYLVYRIGKEILGQKPALIATAIYAISPLVVANVRFSWNPNIVPFFSLLFFYAVWKALRGNHQAWILTSLWFSILIQLHYITLILGAFAGFAWIYVLLRDTHKQKVHKSFFVSTMLALVIFLVSLLPLVAFDMRHEYINSKAFLSFFQGSGNHFFTLDSLKSIISVVLSLFVRNLSGLFSVYLQGGWKLFGGLVVTILYARALFLQKGKTAFFGHYLLLFLFLFSCAVLALYKSTMHDHYLGFLFPIAALFWGVVIASIPKVERLFLPLFLVFIAIFVVTLKHQPYRQDLGYNIFMMKKTALEIQTRLAKDERYNIFLFSPSNDFQGMNYRYFLTTMEHKPASENDFFNFPTLFVIDDLRDSDLVSSPQYQLVVWPQKQVTDEFVISGGPRVSILRR